MTIKSETEQGVAAIRRRPPEIARQRAHRPRQQILDSGSVMGTEQSTPFIKDKLVKKGQPITLSWDANRDCKGTWKKDGRELKNDDRTIITKDHKCFTLTIQKATKEDEGKYTLVLKKSNDIVSGSANIRVVDFITNTAPSAPQLKVDIHRSEDTHAYSSEATGGGEQSEKRLIKTVILSCISTCEAYAKWTKNDGQHLENGGRIHITQSDDWKKFTLTIKEAREEDDGKYTIELFNYNGKASGSKEVKLMEFDKAWRNVEWKKNETAKTWLKGFKPNNSKVTQLRFQLLGPVGAGKSSIVNTIRSIFLGRIHVRAGVDAQSYKSYTKTYKTFCIKDKDGTELPFVFSDIMGLENTKDGGVLPSDVISALKGHVQEGYEFGPDSCLSEDNPYYKSNPGLTDKIHCLVTVIPANKVELYEGSKEVLTKMRDIREIACALEIPQIVFMTFVDECCPLVKQDLKYIYFSKKVRETMIRCSNMLGVPMNCIFPVKNYHQETDMVETTDSLMLNALQKIVNYADDFVTDLVS